MLNALTVDVEEYFQVSLFERHAPPATWDRFPRRAADSVRMLLELFAKRGAKATFFTLGWVAERERTLMREIVAAGHEVASHGYAHRQVHDFLPETFRADLRRSRAAIEDASGQRVRGFRAPSWSIGPRTSWALEVLAEERFVYDSSIFPIRHDRYGWPGAPRHAHVLRLRAGSLIEVPPATARVFGMNVPVAGGGYLRHFPLALMKHGIASLQREGIPAVVYLHPWEIDPGQPRIDAPFLSRVRHYRNISKVLPRLDALLSRFEFGSVTSMLKAAPARSVVEPSLAPAPAPA